MTPQAANPLSDQDSYVLARAFVGLPWADLPVSAAVRLLLSNVDMSVPDDVNALRRVLGPDGLHAVFSIDPNGPSPEGVDQPDGLDTVPDLPESAQLSAEQQTQAAEVGRWLDDYVLWAGGAANETPLIFHQGAGLWLVALAIGRRLYVHTPWGQRVFPNVYVMLVAVSTYYRKSAGLSLAVDVARDAIPHMLLPQPGSPEAFMCMLGGVLPPNFDSLPQRDRERLMRGILFAAQRGIARDEMSAMFKSWGRDFMAGMKELIMQMYDCPAYLDSNTNNRGLVVIQDAALSMLGASTPAELAVALTVADWHNGALARFILLTPEPDYAERPASDDSQLPLPLVALIRHLHEALPVPPGPEAIGDTPPLEPWPLVATEIWEPLRAYEQALRAMTAPDAPLDDRLRGVYGRLHVHALKAAIILAALDWIALGERRQSRPVVRAAHWYRAQGMAEDWRASAHRLLHRLGENEEARLETRILKLLTGRAAGISARDIYRTLGAPRKVVMEALKALEQDGRVSQDLGRQGSRGPRAEVYRLVD